MSRLRSIAIAVAVCAFAGAATAGAAAAAPGDPDTSFGSGGVTSLPSASPGSSFNGVAVQGDRQVVAVGASGNSLLVQRFSASGAAEGAFGAGAGVGQGVVVQPDGKIVVAGYDGAGMLLERFNSSGSLDGGFGSGGAVHAFPGGRANAVALGPNGTIIAAGQVPGVDGFQRVAILRLNSNGSPDSSIGAGGAHVIDLGQDSIAHGVAVEGNGDIVLAGQLGPGAHQVTNAFVARTTSSGALDTTFGSGGAVITFPSGSAALLFNSVALDPAGAIVVGGGTATSNQSYAVFTRLTCSGAPDHSFNGGGTQITPSSLSFSSNPYGANAVAVLAGSRVVGAGRYQNSGLAQAALWGMERSGSLDFAKSAPLGAESNALAIDSSGSLVVAGTNVPAGFFPSGFVARYQGFGGPATGNATCGGAVPVAPTPSLSSVHQSHRTWGESKSSKQHRRPQGTTFSYKLNEAASVTFTFTQRASGRKVKGKCVAQTKKNGHSRSCSRTVTKGSKTVSGRAGNNSLSFNGTISGRNKLRPGTYTVTITASANGKKSKSQSLTFTIVR